jgi:hypothetical protein
VRDGQRRFAASVQATDVNLVCRDVYERSGFQATGEDGHFAFVWSQPLGVAAHLRVEPHDPAVAVPKAARQAQPVQLAAAAAGRRPNPFLRLVRWR